MAADKLLLWPGDTLTHVKSALGFLIVQPVGGKVLPSKPSVTGTGKGVATVKVVVSVSFDGTWSGFTPLGFVVKYLMVYVPVVTGTDGNVTTVEYPNGRLGEIFIVT